MSLCSFTLERRLGKIGINEVIKTNEMMIAKLWPNFYGKITLQYEAGKISVIRKEETFKLSKE